jgi:hypothetical protein
VSDTVSPLRTHHWPLEPGGPLLYLTQTVALERLHRGRCTACGRIRVLFALTARTGSLAMHNSPALCAPCGGLR